MAIVQATNLQTTAVAASVTSAPMAATPTVGNLFVLLTASAGGHLQNTPTDSGTNVWTPIGSAPLYNGTGALANVLEIFGWTAPIVTAVPGHTFEASMVGGGAGAEVIGGVCVELSGRNNATPITLAMSDYTELSFVEPQPGTSIVVTSGASAGADLLSYNVLNSGSTSGIVYTPGSGGWGIPSGAQVNAGSTVAVACMLQVLAGVAPGTYTGGYTINEYDRAIGIILAINAASGGGDGGGAVKNLTTMGVG